ncbi:SAM-dependent methyltransferase, partial [Enterococcus hirae]|nr:SAM-dependent methyltransferase [Enterococcus hirae]
TEDFMRAYYQEYLEETIFKEYIQKYFDPKEKIVSTTMLTYRLLLIKKE